MDEASTWNGQVINLSFIQSIKILCVISRLSPQRANVTNVYSCFLRLGPLTRPFLLLLSALCLHAVFFFLSLKIGPNLKHVELHLHLKLNDKSFRGPRAELWGTPWVTVKSVVKESQHYSAQKSRTDSSCDRRWKHRRHCLDCSLTRLTLGTTPLLLIRKSEKPTQIRSI